MKTAMNKKALLSLLAASAVAMSTPVLAQNYGYGYGDPYGQSGYGYRAGQDLDQRQARLEQRVERLAASGRISRSDYRLFAREFDRFDRLQWAYARNGLSRWERAELSAQLDRIQARIRYERQDDRYDRRDRDRYDDWDRNGRWDRDD